MVYGEFRPTFTVLSLKTSGGTSTSRVLESAPPLYELAENDMGGGVDGRHGPEAVIRGGCQQPQM